MFGGRRADSDVLCCCEYYNVNGEKSHILGCCCDCEHLDSACDRLLTCSSLPDDTCDKMLKVIADRVRLPWCSGRGAVQIRIDLVFPMLTVPICLMFATLHTYATVFVLVAMPLGMYLFYRAWQRRHQKERTRFFYIWALVSIAMMYYVFQVVVFTFRKILLWENLLLSTLAGAMLYFLYLTKKHPGVIVASKAAGGGTVYTNGAATQISNGPKGPKHLHKDSTDYSQPNHEGLPPINDGKDGSRRHNNSNNITYNLRGVGGGGSSHGNQSANQGEAGFETIDIDDERNQLGDTSSLLNHPRGVNLNNDFDKNTKPSNESLHKDFVTWVDSRPFKDNKLVTWCSVCHAMKPPRSGHCNVCNQCIMLRDHHCVWIDSCIGAGNHRSFLVAMVLFIATACYGSHLTLTTVCTPEMYLDWFLIPKDCRFVYSDFPTALSFVCATYSLIAALLMSFGLLQQVFLISQGVTSQELHMASQRGWVSRCGTAENNINNRGCLWNWLSFLSDNRRQSYKPLPL